MDVLNKNGLLTQISYIKAYINNALQNIGSIAIDMSNYVKPDSTSAIDTTDTIVEAIGKLEKGLDGKQNSGSYLTTTDTAADSNKLGGTVASDYALKTDIPTIPTNVSSFNNDSGYLTSVSWDDVSSKPTIPVIPTNISSFTNDEGYLVSSDLNGYATENYVNTAVSGLVNSAPAALDTLNELATALGNDANFATTVSTQIGTKVSVDSANYIKGASVSNNTLTLTKGDDTTVTFTDNNTTYSNATTSVDGLMSANDKTKLDGIEEYTGSEVNTIWLDYFNPFVTVTITQSENQTIHVLINNETDYTETFSVRTGAQYSVSVVPDTGYTAGTVSSSSGTISEAITISATSAVLDEGDGG